MRKHLITVLCTLLFVPAFGSPARADSHAPVVKEWTFLTFLNGNNNLDSFGDLNINQMEKIGSTPDLNIVVQWASLSRGKTVRLYVQKDNDTNTVTSPVVQDLGAADMGSWKTLVEFIRWGVENYPAKKYFINVWDHGSGWHAIKLRRGGMIHPTDISWDDTTGHSITTIQLGMAIAEAAKIIGHPVDLYASDACLMAMAEVAGQMAGNVRYFGGSEEVEPGAGWPYDDLLNAWVKKPFADGGEVGTMLTNAYVASYNGGQYGTQDATFSAFDMSKLGELESAITDLGSHIASLGSEDLKTVRTAAMGTQSFTYADYGDFGDFLTNLGSLDSVRSSVSGAKQAMKDFVIAAGASGRAKRARGLSIWLPTQTSDYSSYVDLYNTLVFPQETKWGNALKVISQPSL